MTRNILILPVLNGFICEVGCQQVVFQDRHQMLGELAKYYEKPDETEAHYLKNAVNKMMRDCPCPTPAGIVPHQQQNLCVEPSPPGVCTR